MKLEHLHGVSEKDNDPEIEEILVRFDPYIIALVQNKACHSSNSVRPEELDLEIDEITQRVRIKFWRALEAKRIVYPKAYIHTIVNNEFNDLGRKRNTPRLMPLEIEDLGIDELVRTICWSMPHNRKVTSFQTFVKHIVHTWFVKMICQYRSIPALSTNEDSNFQIAAFSSIRKSKSFRLWRTTSGGIFCQWG